MGDEQVSGGGKCPLEPLCYKTPLTQDGIKITLLERGIILTLR